MTEQDTSGQEGEELNRAFFEACWLNDMDGAERSLREGADSNARNRIGQTALHRATRERDSERAAWLLERGGADPDLTERWSGRTALHHASSSEGGNLELVRLLCEEYGADLDITDAKGRTALWEATLEENYEVANYLVQRGARFDLVPPKDGRSVLHLAATPKGYVLEFYHPNMTLLTSLVERGADVDLPCTETGETPVHAACKVQDMEILELFVRAVANTNAVTKKGESVLYYALKYKSCTSNRIAEYLLEYQGADPNVPSNDTGDYPLHLAPADYDTASELLRHGAKTDCRNTQGNTPLHVACTVDFNEGMLELLVEHGADVLARNAKGQTPLHLVCKGSLYSRYSRLEMMQVLVEHGADATAEDAEGRTPLHHSCQSKAAHLDMVQCLVEQGVDVLAVDADGRTAFDRACEAGHLDILYYFLRDHHWLKQLFPE